MTPAADAPALDRALARLRDLTDAALDASLPPEGTQPATVHAAMRYAVFGRAKRLRPALALAVAEALGTDPGAVAGIAASIELIHTYSLIHDDLPCMDDDDMRRGRPTCHVKFGEAVAVLAGDALLTLAFEMILEHGRRRGDPPEVLLAVIEELSRAAGSRGMISGQVLDLDAEGREVGLAELEEIHALKTGRLFTASVRIGGLLARADAATMAGLTRYSESLGKVFQIVDDILDETGTTHELGKPAGSDQKNDKATYPRLLGLDGARDEAARHAAEARAELDAMGLDPTVLGALLQYLLERRS